MTLRNVVVLAILAALGLLVWIAVSGEEEDDVLPSVFPKFDRSEVTRLVVRGQGSTLDLARRAEGGDTWDVVTGTDLVRADGAAVDEILLSISRQTVRARWDHEKITEGDLADFGLKEPLIEAELTAAGKPLLVRYGKRTSEGTNAYADAGAGTDVYVIPTEVVESLISAISGGLRDKRVFDIRAYDVAQLEIERKGVTTLQVERDVTQVWRITQPFKGYANHTKFETELGRIVNAEVEAWAEVGAQDLVKYGLESPEFVVTLTKRRDETPASVLVGKATGEEGASRFVMEKGTRNVAVAGKRFAEAIAVDAQQIRDRSFTRLGIDGVAIDVNLGPDATYKLVKEGSTWDVQAGVPRYPADSDGAVASLLEDLRSWETQEFLDAAKPEDYGIDGTKSIRIERQGGGTQPGGTTVLLVGEAGGAWYGMREGDGGVEKIDPAPLQKLLRGYLQFRRKIVRAWVTNEINKLAREKGRSEEGEKAHSFEITRDVEGGDRTWKLTGGGGRTGALDANAINDILKVLENLRAEQWLFWSPAKNEEMGFIDMRLAQTLSLVVEFPVAFAPAEGETHVLLVGNKHPDGGYYARITGNHKPDEWAFVMSEADVELLKRNLTRD